MNCLSQNPFSGFVELLNSGGVIFWVLIAWGTYLFYLLLDTRIQLKTKVKNCDNLDCMFALQCRNWQTVDLSCRRLRQEMTQELEGRLRFLKIAVNTSPLLGLLGTVIGIFKTFSALGSTPGLNTGTALSSGISEALLTTQLGLIIAIPSFIILRRILYKLSEVDRRLSCFESQCKRSWHRSPAARRQLIQGLSPEEIQA